MPPTHEASKAQCQSWILALAAAAFVLLALPVSAIAALPPQIWQAPESGQPGPTAGQIDHPTGIATDPSSGHVYIADSSNSRVTEFDAWGQFVKSWGWGVADGSAELQTCGPGATPPTTTCQAGISGNGVGQFNGTSGGIAVDSAGDVVVGDLFNSRIQTFDPDGEFVRMFGKEVDKGPNHAGAVCTAAYVAEGEACGAGTKGTGPGELSSQDSNDIITANASGTVFVGGTGRIQAFGNDGAFQEEISSPALTCGENPPCQRVFSLDVDDAGNFYVVLVDPSFNAEAKKLNATGDVLFTFPMANELFPSVTIDQPRGITRDVQGNVYIAISHSHEAEYIFEVIEFDSSGNLLIPPRSEFLVSRNKVYEFVVSPSYLTTNVVSDDGGIDLYMAGTTASTLSYARAYGPPPVKWTPPHFSPEILAQYATSVEPSRAVLGARINPRFWGDTSYYVEWGLGKCSEGGCPNRQPTEQGTELGAGAVGTPAVTKGVVLPGLSPDTTYHYRFVAQSSGGGPVYGVGAEESEASLTTPRLAIEPNEACPNQTFRSGPSAKLPDCRAYEMVSPVDKNNTDIISLINVNSNLAALNVSAQMGNKLTYTTSQGFGDTQGVPYVSQYIASRGQDGWSNHAITPSQGFSPVSPGQRVDMEFRAFTPDLCHSVLQHVTDPPLAPGAPEGWLNLYNRRNCGEETYKTVTTTAPTTAFFSPYLPEVQGLSPDGRCTLFYANDKLTPDANPGTAPKGSNRQVYESCDGNLRVVSVLPNGKPATSDAAAGTPYAGQGIRSGTDAQALSSDGSRVYWTEADVGPGKIYARINADQEQSKMVAGQCSEEEKACTLKVSQTVSPLRGSFWGASPDGSHAIFTMSEGPLKGNLYEFNLEAGTSELVAPQVTGIVGFGSQGETSRAYFVSEKALTGPNAEDRSPSEGQPNLYFYEGVEEENDEEEIEVNRNLKFIGTLFKRDALTSTTAGGDITSVNNEPYKKASRVSPDGSHVAFVAAAPLTGYDSTDQATGAADLQVYVYDSTAENLSCVSCNPTGQRPEGRPVVVEGYLSTRAAAYLPTYPTELYGSRALSEDGSRVFFNGYEALLPRDTNGRADVYEWEAPGAGDCAVGSPDYSPPNGGCINLISTGQSPSDSEFVDASADGRDVFFTTASSLLPQDPGLIDIYDAREEGGYPPPPIPTPSCEGEACQGAPAPPNDPTPASSAFEGAGNVREGKAKKKKAHKKKHAKRHKRANKSRRAGR